MGTKDRMSVKRRIEDRLFELQLRCERNLGCGGTCSGSWGEASEDRHGYGAGRHRGPSVSGGGAQGA